MTARCALFFTGLATFCPGLAAAAEPPRPGGVRIVVTQDGAETAVLRWQPGVVRIDQPRLGTSTVYDLGQVRVLTLIHAQRKATASSLAVLREAERRALKSRSLDTVGARLPPEERKRFEAELAAARSDTPERLRASPAGPERATGAGRCTPLTVRGRTLDGTVCRGRPKDVRVDAMLDELAAFRARLERLGTHPGQSLAGLGLFFHAGPEGVPLELRLRSSLGGETQEQVRTVEAVPVDPELGRIPRDYQSTTR